MQRLVDEQSGPQATIPPRPQLRTVESIPFPAGRALSLVDQVPVEGRAIISQEGEGFITLVPVGEYHLVEKNFYDGNQVSPKAGPFFAQKASRNGEGLIHVATTLNSRLAPLGITVVAPPFEEDEKRMITPLIRAPDLDFLWARLVNNSCLPGSEVRKHVTDEFVTNHPELTPEHVSILGRHVMTIAYDLRFRLKEADLILLDARLGDTGVQTQHERLKLQATLVLMDLH